MFLPADVDPPADRLLLEMALQAQDMIALDQHPRVDRPVWVVASRAALPHRLVFEDEGTALGHMAFAAGLLLGGKGRAAADDRRSLVWIMTITATDFSSCGNGPGLGAVKHRMSVRKAELGAFVQVALKTRLRRFARVNNCAMRAARLVVNARRTVTGFAADVFGVVARGLQPRMGRSRETSCDVFMALSAGFRSREGSTGDLRRGHGRPVNCRAGNDEKGGQDSGNGGKKPHLVLSSPASNASVCSVTFWAH